MGDGTFRVSGFRPLEEATYKDLSLYSDRRYRRLAERTGAGALMVSAEAGFFPGPQVVVDHPVLAHARIAGLFAPELSEFRGIHEKAVVHVSSRIGRDVTIHPLVTVGMDVHIGDRVTLFPGVFVGDRVRIGEGTLVHSNVSILHDCVVGREVIIHAGSVIGSDGYGFVWDGRRHVKIPQIGTVSIGDHVEIGANNTVDRAALGTTRVERGVKTDNLVHIAHNVVVGEDTLIVAQAALSGSVVIGRGVIIGGQVGIGDHVSVGDRAMIGSQSGVAKSLGPGEVVSGTPAMPHRLWLKTRGLLTRLPGLSDRVRDLERRVEDLVRRLEERN